MWSHLMHDGLSCLWLGTCVCSCPLRRTKEAIVDKQRVQGKGWDVCRRTKAGTRRVPRASPGMGCPIAESEGQV